MYCVKRPNIHNEELFRKGCWRTIEGYKKNPVFQGFHRLGANLVVYQFYTLSHLQTYNFKL